MLIVDGAGMHTSTWGAETLGLLKEVLLIFCFGASAILDYSERYTRDVTAFLQVEQMHKTRWPA
jgi:hypothetical protein